MADDTDRDTCIADSSSTHESICIESTHAVLPTLRQNAIHKKQPIQLRDNQRNLPISNKPYHKAQSGKVITQIETNQNTQTHIIIHKLTPICALSSGLYNGAFKRNGYVNCIKSQSQSRSENCFYNPMDVTQGTHNMRSYVNLSYWPPISLATSLSCLLPQGCGSYLIPYSQVSSFNNTPFVSFDFIILLFSWKTTICPHLHCHTTPISYPPSNSGNTKKVVDVSPHSTSTWQPRHDTMAATFTTRARHTNYSDVSAFNSHGQQQKREMSSKFTCLNKTKNINISKAEKLKCKYKKIEHLQMAVKCWPWNLKSKLAQNGRV